MLQETTLVIYSYEDRRYKQEDESLYRGKERHLLQYFINHINW